MGTRQAQHLTNSRHPLRINSVSMNISGEHAVVIEESIDRRWVEMETSGSGLPVRPTHPYPKVIVDLGDVACILLVLVCQVRCLLTNRTRISASRFLSRHERFSSWASSGQYAIHDARSLILTACFSQSPRRGHSTMPSRNGRCAYFHLVDE